MTVDLIGAYARDFRFHLVEGLAGQPVFRLLLLSVHAPPHRILPSGGRFAEFSKRRYWTKGQLADVDYRYLPPLLQDLHDRQGVREQLHQLEEDLPQAEGCACDAN